MSAAVLLKVLIGFVVGALVGLTGLGGAVLLLPLLIFGLGIPAVTAIGSDALFNFITKIPTSAMHIKYGNVRWRVVMGLATGSIPGSYLGATLLQHMKQVYGPGMNDVVKMVIGVLLLIVPMLLLFQDKLQKEAVLTGEVQRPIWLIALIGLGAGFLVGMTSVGSGSIIMLLLLLFCHFDPRHMVGTDIAHAVLLTGFTSLLHWKYGNIDTHLVGMLLIGSIPGGILGARLSSKVPVLWLRRMLCTVLFLTGIRMLIPV